MYIMIYLSIYKWYKGNKKSIFKIRKKTKEDFKYIG